MYDTAIILSQNREPDGSLGKEFRNRLDFGINDYLNGLVSSLTMSGNHGRSDEHLKTSQAEDMKDYALAKGVPSGNIFLEPNSVDTVGQAVFTKRDIIIPNDIGNVVVISSDYHLTRVAVIFDFVYGDETRKLYASTPTNLIRNPEIMAAQERSLEAFLRTFEGIERGNLEAIEDRLFTKHPLYAGRREGFGGI